MDADFVNCVALILPWPWKEQNMTKQRKLMQGNEACVLGALYTGLNFFAGYPITPSELPQDKVVIMDMH